MMDYETLVDKMSDAKVAGNASMAFAVLFLVISLIIMIYAAYGVMQLRGELMNQMIERRIVYKRARLQEQVENREGNYRSHPGIQIAMEVIDRD